MERKSIVYDCSFLDFKKIGNGTVFEIKNIELTIECCSFEDNTITRCGGSLYLTNCVLHLSKTTFTRCQSEADENNIGGNVIHQDQGTVLSTHVSAFLCGKSSDYHGDSCFKLDFVRTKMCFMNMSSNYGDHGGTLAIWETPSDSAVSFINMYEIRDSAAVESYRAKYPISKSNFVGFSKSKNHFIVWTEKDDVLEFNECCFYETDGVPFSYNGYSIFIHDCIMEMNSKNDYSSSFTYVQEISLHHIILKLQCTSKICTSPGNNFRSLVYRISHSMLFIFVLIRSN